jgi:hypothetical protein
MTTFPPLDQIFKKPKEPNKFFRWIIHKLGGLTCQELEEERHRLAEFDLQLERERKGIKEQSNQFIKFMEIYNSKVVRSPKIPY